MTKLEKKLLKLGYEKSEDNMLLYFKYYTTYMIKIFLAKGYKEIVDNCILCVKHIDSQDDINSLQIAFKIMERELEVLKQCQD